MYKIKIFGAGSIGNHLAHGCAGKGWQVTICDLDPAALERTKNDIYPVRYGSWDNSIRLTTPEKVVKEDFDLVIVGTPPDTHMAIARHVLETRAPRVLLIEKPVCTPKLENTLELLSLQEKTGCFVAVGYNHTLTAHSRRAAELLAGGLIGQPLTLSAGFREFWGGIFNAHSWLHGPQDSYLGFSSRGGGAGGEHSHATNIWQHFAGLVGMGKIIEVSAMLDMVSDDVVDYDRLFQLNVKTEAGLVGTIVQDVVTEPPEKLLRIQGSTGFLEWRVNADTQHDALRYAGADNTITEELFAKTRPDDFLGELDHLGGILAGESSEKSPISLVQGLNTMLVVAAAHLSSRKKRSVRIHYEAGYCHEAFELL